MELAANKKIIQLNAHTPRAVISYRCETNFVHTKCLEPFLNKPYFDSLCENGCPNYGSKWSCPPYAPDYKQFVKKYEYLYVFLLSIELDRLAYIKQQYLKVRAANTILKSRIDKALRSAMDENESYISSGSCRLCKSCRKKASLPCAYPGRMTYSFEALGIDVSLLTEHLFQRELRWYREKRLPEYTSVAAGLLTNDKNENTKVVDILRALS